MNEKTITINLQEGFISNILTRLGRKKKSSPVLDIRKILTKEKLRILQLCKTKQPDSIYSLAKLLGRDFKSVWSDIRLLEKYGFIELISSKKKGREILKPVVESDQITLILKF